jgi:prophage DNA circulation protein
MDETIEQRDVDATFPEEPELDVNSWVDRETYDAVVAVQAVQRETINALESQDRVAKLVESTAELRRQISTKDEQINAYANPLPPTYTLSAEVVQAVVSILTKLPYNQVNGVLSQLQQETAPNG